MKYVSAVWFTLGFAATLAGTAVVDAASAQGYARRGSGEGVDVTADLATIDAYRGRLAVWKEGFATLAAKRQASYVDLSSDVPLDAAQWEKLLEIAAKTPVTRTLAAGAAITTTREEQ